ncbi:hypothetical protein ABE493_07860 [Stenotrophomonas terrae]|uniref:hypothetical protein n=1 Tax=Stenotrophomonas terrae TaxID=405446 RepID=UPI00320AC4F7
MTTANVAAGKRGRISMGFELQGALSASRNLGLLADRLPWVQRRAIQTLRRRLPVEARRDAQAEYNIGLQRFNRDISTRITDEEIKLVGHFRGIGLRNYAARQTAKGITASVIRGRRSQYPGAFFAQLNSGNVQVVSRFGAKRVMTQGRYKGKRRQPIAVEYGATVAQMLAKGRRPERLADFARGVLQREVMRLFDYYDHDGPMTTNTEDSQ